jgi:multiple sugar transport system substrate-binding protein
MRTLLIAILTASTIAVGCSKEKNGARSASSGQQLTIWWAEWAPANGLQELASDFEKETGIAVKVHQIPWSSYQDQVFLNFSNKQTDFDIVVGDSQWIGRGATNKLYVDLSDWLPGAVDLKTIHPLALKYLCEYPTGSGKYFAAPCETDAIGFAYRKDWFDDPKEKQAFKAKYGRELAVPATWEEFRDVPSSSRAPIRSATAARFSRATITTRSRWDFSSSCGRSAARGVTRKRSALTATSTVPARFKPVMFVKELLKFAPPGGSNFSYDKTIENFKNGSAAMAMDYFAVLPRRREVDGAEGGILPRAGAEREALRKPRRAGDEHLDENPGRPSGKCEEVHRVVF